MDPDIRERTATYITARYQHPAWQLLASRRAPLVLSCLRTLFEATQNDIPFDDALQSLADLPHPTRQPGRIRDRCRGPPVARPPRAAGLDQARPRRRARGEPLCHRRVGSRAPICRWPRQPHHDLHRLPTLHCPTGDRERRGQPQPQRPRPHRTPAPPDPGPRATTRRSRGGPCQRLDRKRSTHLTALMMDGDLFDACHSSSVPETTPAPESPPAGLTAAERDLYQYLHGLEKGRVEQEFVPPEKVVVTLQRWRENR
jgi:hypothetical protein